MSNDRQKVSNDRHVVLADMILADESSMQAREAQVDHNKAREDSP